MHRTVQSVVYDPNEVRLINPYTKVSEADHC